LLFALVYIVSILIGYLLVTYYFNKINLQFTVFDLAMILIPLINVGTVLACLYCIITKRHYEPKQI
jgi:hypothetical protein